MLDDELPDNEKEKRGNGQSSKTNNQGCQSTGKKVALDATGNVSGGQSGKKQARRSLDFLAGMDDVGWEQVNCVNLLEAMELDGEEEEQTDKDSVLYEEEESMQLPNEWVDIIASQRKNQWSIEI